MVAAAFLIRSQTKDVSARSLVQDSGAPAWLSTAARDPRFDCSLRSRRCSPGCRCVSRADGTDSHCSAISSCTQLAAGAGLAALAPLFERSGGANIVDPPTSSMQAASQVLAGARPSCLPSSPRPRFMNTSANELRARAAGWSGSASTMGTPASPEARSSGSRGICASRDTG